MLLLRHGRTDWNVEGRLQGRTDVPLNAEGIAGARRAAAQLATMQAGGGWPDGRLARILSSPLMRALDTARIVGAATGVDVTVDPRLTERDFGGLEGMLHSEILARGGLGADFALQPDLPDGAEGWGTMQARMLAAYRECAAGRQPALIVSHMAALTALVQALGLDPPAFANSTLIAL